MSSRLKVGLIVTFLIAVALFAAFWSIVMLSSVFQERRLPPPGGSIVGDFELFYVANNVISTINITLLVILILTYVNIYVKTRSPFTIGLIIFAAAFLMKDLTSSPFISGLFSFRAFGLGPFVFLPGVFESAALLVLLYLSIRY